MLANSVTTQGNLKAHIQVQHEGIKYACNLCDFTYSDQSHLRRHIQSKHEGVKYYCNHCDYQTGYKGHLTQHMKSKHEVVDIAQLDPLSQLNGEMKYSPEHISEAYQNIDQFNTSYY